jgi:DNA-binding LytR/AlgR family response regulator
MMLRTLIVDDEPVARRILREELQQLPNTEIVGEAETGAAALDMISAARPDLVLLDLEMPDLGGFEVARRLKGTSNVPAIVVVTAWDQYAIQAFEAGAVDYLLKPVGQERLAEAVERARRLSSSEAAERLAKLNEIGEPAAAGGPARKIVGRKGEEYVLLATSEVFAFQAEGELVWILTAKHRFLATQTLKNLEERLRDTSFRRIHRSALVNIDHVRKVSTLTSQRWLVTLSNRLEFIVSKRQARGIRELLNW